MFRALSSVLFISRHDCFSVAVCIKDVPEFFELLAQFAVVVDLAVKYEPLTAIAVVHWLVPAFDLEDRQPAHAQADAATKIEAIVVGTAMTDRVGHPLKQAAIDGRIVGAHNSSYAAHCLILNSGAKVSKRCGAALTRRLRLPSQNAGGHCERCQPHLCRRAPPSLFALLEHQDSPDGDENEIEDQELGSLPISRAHISLKYGIRDC